MSLFDRLLGRSGRKEPTRRQQADPSARVTTWAKPEDTRLRANDKDLQSAVLSGALLPVPHFSVGDRIVDTYEVKRIIEGGMGTVYVSHHDRWNLDVVVKVPRAEILADPDNRHRIATEAEAWTDLGLHPHIAYCYYVHPLDGLPLVVIEYLDGGNLRDWIAEGRCADLRVGLDLATQFCHGLEHAHNCGLIHRDIKPENILLTRDGTLKITDFGIVRIGDPRGGMTSNRTTMDGRGDADRSSPVTAASQFGSAGYMSPEQWDDPHNVDARADVFAFGVCLYEMFCGRGPYGLAVGPPQEAPEPQVLRGDDTLPKRLCNLMKQCVDWQRKQRPQRVVEIRKELCEIHEEVFHEPNLFASMPELSIKADGLNNRAVSYETLNREKEAIRCWQEALAQDPHHLEATYNRGVYLWRHGKLKDYEFVQQLESIESSQRDGWKINQLLTLVHLERGDLNSATQVLREVAQNASSDKEIQETLAEVKGTLSLEDASQRLLKGHTSQVNSVCFSVDGSLALSGSSDCTVRSWDVSSGQCLQILEGHTANVTSVCLSPDGRLALSGSSDRTLRLWRVPTRECLRVFTGHEAGVETVCLTSNGRLALSADSDSSMRAWDITTGRCVWVLGEFLRLRRFGPVVWASGPKKEGHLGMNSVSLSANGRVALSGSSDSSLRLWEMTTGRCLGIYEGHTQSVTSVCLGPDGRWGVSGSEDQTIRFWDFTGNTARVLEEEKGYVKSICVSTNGKWALSFTEGIQQDKGMILQLWEMEWGRCRRTWRFHAAGLRSISLSEDAQWTAFGFSDGSVQLTKQGCTAVCSYRPSKPMPVRQLLEGEKCTRKLLEAANEAVALGDYDEAVALMKQARSTSSHQRTPSIRRAWAQLSKFCVRTGLRAVWPAGTVLPHQLLYTKQPHPGKSNIDVDPGYVLHKGRKEVTSICVNADDRFVLSGSRDETICLWDLTTGHLRAFGGQTDALKSVCLSDDGQYALSGGNDRTLQLWEVSTGLWVRRFEGHSHWVMSVCFSSDGRRALSASLDASIKLWDVPTGYCLRTFDGHTRGVTTVCLSPAESQILSGSWDSTLRLWDLATGRCLRTFEGHSALVSSACFSAHGLWAFSGSGDHSLRLWKVSTGECIRVFEGHLAGVMSVCLSSDGLYGVSGSCDGTVRIWEVDTGRCIWEATHNVAVMAVCISRDGRWIFSAGADGKIQCWELDWELASYATAAWDERARPYLENFVVLHGFRESAHWTDADFQKLLRQLQWSGFGWLRSEGLRSKLEEVASKDS